MTIYQYFFGPVEQEEKKPAEKKEEKKKSELLKKLKTKDVIALRIINDKDDEVRIETASKTYNSYYDQLLDAAIWNHSILGFAAFIKYCQATLKAAEELQKELDKEDNNVSGMVDDSNSPGSDGNLERVSKPKRFCERLHKRRKGRKSANDEQHNERCAESDGKV